MHILILEFALSGHHANYLKHISELFLKKGHRVTIAVPNKFIEDQLFIDLKTLFGDYFQIETIKIDSFGVKLFLRLGLIGKQVAYWYFIKMFFQRVNQKKEFEFVFMPFLDYCLYAIALLGFPFKNMSWSGICMRTSFHFSRVGVISSQPKLMWLKEKLFYRLLLQSNLQKIFTIDETLKKEVLKKSKLIARKLVYIPDPAELGNQFDFRLARQYFGIGEHETVILVYGGIDSRKGIENLLRYAHSIYCMRSLRILVIGKHSFEQRNILAKESRVISVDERADSLIEEAGFRAADLVWLGYENHNGMSGVAILAAAAGKLSIATRNGLIGWMTQQYNLGSAIDCRDPKAISIAIKSLLSRNLSQTNDGMLVISQRHTWNNFNHILEKNLMV